MVVCLTHEEIGEGIDIVLIVVLIFLLLLFSTAVFLF